MLFRSIAVATKDPGNAEARNGASRNSTSMDTNDDDYNAVRRKNMNGEDSKRGPRNMPFVGFKSIIKRYPKNVSIRTVSKYLFKKRREKEQKHSSRKENYSTSSRIRNTTTTNDVGCDNGEELSSRICVKYNQNGKRRQSDESYNKYELYRFLHRETSQLLAVPRTPSFNVMLRSNTQYSEASNLVKRASMRITWADLDENDKGTYLSEGNILRIIQK